MKCYICNKRASKEDCARICTASTTVFVHDECALAACNAAKMILHTQKRGVAVCSECGDPTGDCEHASLT